MMILIKNTRILFIFSILILLIASATSRVPFRSFKTKREVISDKEHQIVNARMLLCSKSETCNILTTFTVSDHVHPTCHDKFLAVTFKVKVTDSENKSTLLDTSAYISQLNSANHNEIIYEQATEANCKAIKK